MTASPRFILILLPAFVFACSAPPATTAASTPSTFVGTFWSEKGVVLTAADFGHPENSGQLFFADSEIVRLPDRRLRIYMFNGSASGIGSIGSMVSIDGVHWTMEPGERCRTSSSRTCGQIAVVQVPSGGWKIFGNTDGGISSASSSNGLTWHDDPGLRISNASFPGSTDESLSGPHITPVAGGGWRMYFHKAGPNWHPGSTANAPQILSAFSTDLVSWTPDPGVRATGALHPNVVALPKGGYEMFANTGFELTAAASADGLTWPTTFTQTHLQGGDPVPLLMSDGSIGLYYNDGDFLAHQGGGLFWADQETATWDVNFDARIDMTTVRVTGSGKSVTVRVTDRGRSKDRPVSGLPFTSHPPFEVSFALPLSIAYQPLVEVSDGSMNRYFDAYNLPKASNCGPGTGTPCPPINCGPGTGTPCASSTTCPSGLVPNGTSCINPPCQPVPGRECSPIPCGVGEGLPCAVVHRAKPCQAGQPVDPQNGCIATNPNGVQEYCPPKPYTSPPYSEACKPFYDITP